MLTPHTLYYIYIKVLASLPFSGRTCSFHSLENSMKGYVGGNEKFYFYCTFYYLLFDIVCLCVHKTSSEATTVMSIFPHTLSLNNCCRFEQPSARTKKKKERD